MGAIGFGTTTPLDRPDLSGFGPAAPLSGLDAGERARSDFAQILGIADRGAATAGVGGEQAARETAEQFVAQVLVQPLLSMVRSGNDQPPPFGPGPGEQKFGAFIDAQRAMDLVRSADWPIVDRIARDLAQRAGRGVSNGQTDALGADGDGARATGAAPRSEAHEDSAGSRPRLAPFAPHTPIGSTPGTDAGLNVSA